MPNQVLFANRDATTLAAAITTSQTAITVTSGSGALFPSPATGQFFPLVLVSGANNNTYEITYCTARSADTLTVTRAQEGTAALAFNAGDLAQNLLTAGAMALLPQLGTTNTWTAIQTFTNPPVIPNATASNNPVALGQIAPVAPQIARTTTVNTANTTTTTTITFTAPSSGFVIAACYVSLSAAPVNAQTYETSLQINGSALQLDNNPNNQAEFNTQYVAAGTAVTVTAIVFVGATPLNGDSNLQLLAFFIPTPGVT